MIANHPMGVSLVAVQVGGPAPGLRELKKCRTRDEILENAIAIFRRDGIRQARLGDIARASQVSPATLFNYFPTKSSLADAWVRGEIDRALAAMVRGLGDHGLRSAVRTLCRDLSRWDEEERRVRLEAWGEAGRAPAFRSVEGHPLTSILRREQRRGRLRSDVSAESQSEMLIDAIESGLIAGLRGGLGSIERAGDLQARVDLILDGARKRNERVAAPRVERVGSRRPEEGNT